MKRPDYSTFPIDAVEGDSAVYRNRTYTYYAEHDMWVSSGIDPNAIDVVLHSVDYIDPLAGMGKTRVVSFIIDVQTDPR